MVGEAEAEVEAEDCEQRLGGEGCKNQPCTCTHGSMTEAVVALVVVVAIVVVFAVVLLVVIAVESY